MRQIWAWPKHTDSDVVSLVSLTSHLSKTDLKCAVRELTFTPEGVVRTLSLEGRTCASPTRAVSFDQGQRALKLCELMSVVAESDVRVDD